MAEYIFIDNDPETVSDELYEALGRDEVEVILYPDDFSGNEATLTAGKLARCNVVLMDFELCQDNEPIFGFAPRNGIALEETIRSWLTGAGQPLGGGIRAFVLFSHELEGLGGNLGYSGREHVIARTTGNEWVSSKNANNRREGHKDLVFLSKISDAIAALRVRWPQDGSAVRSETLALLGLVRHDEQHWHSLAADDAERAGLPLQSLEAGQSISLLRWLLHVAFPFPSCLVDITDVAVQLRVDPISFTQNTDVLANLEKLLAPFVYDGLAKDFLGKRWWRSGILTFVDELIAKGDRGRAGVAETLGGLLSARPEELVPLSVTHPVRTVDDRFVLGDEIADISDCVRVLTEDWPEELNRPWMSIETACSASRLLSLVHPDDRYRLPEVKA